MATNFNVKQAHAGPLGGISAVVTTLPDGNVLGETRIYEGVHYKLVYQAAGDASPGKVNSPIPVGSGPYSMSSNTVSDGVNHMGAVVCIHASAVSGSYYWGAYKGVVASMVASAGSAIPTGKFAMVGADGFITSAPSLPTELVGNAADAIYVISTAPSGVQGGSCYINFE